MALRLYSTWAAIAVVAAGQLTWAAELGDLVGEPVQKVVGECQFTEGPAWHPDGYLLFSDIPNSRIIRVNADGSSSDWMNPSGGANGLVCDQEGNVYACQGAERRVVKLRSNSDGVGELVAVLASEYDGKPLNQPNDLALDGQGGLYFTDPNYRRDEPESQPVQAVYYVSSDGGVSRVIDDLPRPNGILVTADGQTLYVANIEVREIIKYPIEGPGKIGAGQVLFTGEEEQDGRGPDGMALDEQGNIYATYSSLLVVSPAGELIGRLPVDEKPANCTFGGPDGRTLYITARTSLYSAAAGVAGASPMSSGPAGGDSAAASETKTVKAGDLRLQIPGNWKQGEPSNNLRLAQFEIPAAKGDAEAAELVVSGPFGGSDEANISRWIGQFAAEERKSTVSKGKCDQGDYVVMELSGTYNKPDGPPFLRKTKPAPGSRMLGAILKLKGGNYFLKLTGPDKTVAAAADAFRASFGGDKTKETREPAE